MKILIFSDTHLTEKFDERLYKHLVKIISGVDQVIINGDFWDGYITSFNKFVNSKWNKLFPLLLAKNTIYLYGNHDTKSLVSEKYNLFAVKAEHRYTLKSGNKTFNIEHGNRFLKSLNEKFHIKKPPFFLKKGIKFVYSKEEKMIQTFGKSVLQIQNIAKNQLMKNKIQKEQNKTEFYICGHSHCAEIDLNQKYLNTGIIRYGLSQYILIENGDFQFKEEWYYKNN